MQLHLLLPLFIAFYNSPTLAAPHSAHTIVRRSDVLKNWPLWDKFDSYIRNHPSPNFEFPGKSRLPKAVQLSPEDIFSKHIHLKPNEQCHPGDWYFYGKSDASTNSIEHTPDGKVAVEDKIGQGGFGIVYDGWFFKSGHEHEGQLSAIKTQGGNDKEKGLYGAYLQWKANDFENRKIEAAKAKTNDDRKKKALERDRHILDVSTYFSVEEDGDDKAVLVMPLMDMSLERLRSDSRLNRPDMGYQMLVGLQNFQQAKVAHFDIKPANIMVKIENGYPIAKFMDFDEGVDFSAETDSTKYPVTGEAGYICPEMLERGRSPDKTFDAEKCDLWSLGISLIDVVYYYEPPTTIRPYFQNEDQILKLWKSLVQTKDESTKSDGRVGLSRTEVRDALDDFFGKKMHSLVKGFFSKVLCKADDPDRMTTNNARIMWKAMVANPKDKDGNYIWPLLQQR